MARNALTQVRRAGTKQVKGKRWMPWHREATKDVVGCEKPRGAASQALIRGCPNGVTLLAIGMAV